MTARPYPPDVLADVAELVRRYDELALVARWARDANLLTVAVECRRDLVRSFGLAQATVVQS